jgi:putative inorganic carbon (HCO3(-)) transporter
LHLEKIRSIYPSVLLVTGLVIISLVATYLIVNVGVMVGPAIAVLLIWILVVGMIFKDYMIGIYVMFGLCVFMSSVSRFFNVQFPFGVVVDAVTCLIFVIMLFNIREREKWSAIKSPVTYLYTAIIVYQLLQVFNPNAVSFAGWLVASRGITAFLLFFVFFQLFLSFENVRKFTVLWMAMAAIVAFYGIYQEVFGLNAREMRWLYAAPGRINLYKIWGHIRIFSFLSDPSAYGLFMAFSGLGCFILAMGPFKGFHKLVLGILGLAMMIAMSYSGTRTAFAMVAFGVPFYILLTLRSRKTLIIMVGAGVVAVLVLFGPFYGGTLNRIRSTFNTSEDASMHVRDKKRLRMQTYVRSHPFGGGLLTTGTNGMRYSPGHPLATGWDPDSGYLFIALETGWIGLTMALFLFGSVTVKGINNHFSLEDPVLKTYNLAYVVPFMSLSVAHFTQDALFQKPVYLVIIATYALVLTLPTNEKRIVNNLYPMKKILFLLLVSTHVFGQSVDYNKIILPDNVQSPDFAERLVQLAWKNDPLNEALQRQVTISEYAVKSNASQWLDIVRVTGNQNELKIKPEADIGVSDQI